MISIWVGFRRIDSPNRTLPSKYLIGPAKVRSKPSPENSYRRQADGIKIKRLLQMVENAIYINIRLGVGFPTGITAKQDD